MPPRVCGRRHLNYLTACRIYNMGENFTAILLNVKILGIICYCGMLWWTCMQGYGMQGEGSKALRLFEEMKRFQIKPDHITMVAVLSACSHSGLLKQDLFGRVGLLNKAKEIITRMPYIPTTAMWATLIGACCIYGNADIGEWAAEKLLELRPAHSGYYVLVANMYAAAGSWSKLAKIRTLMRDSGVAKAPGCSWVDVGSGFISFLVGDTSNSRALESKLMLDNLNDVMKHGSLVTTDYYDIVDDIF